MIRLLDDQAAPAPPPVVERHPAVEYQPHQAHKNPVVPVVGKVEGDDFALVPVVVVEVGVGWGGRDGARVPQGRKCRLDGRAAEAAHLAVHLVLQFHALNVAGGHLRLQLPHFSKPFGQQPGNAAMPDLQGRVGLLQGQGRHVGGGDGGGAERDRRQARQPGLHGFELLVGRAQGRAPLAQLLLNVDEHELAHLQLLHVGHLPGFFHAVPNGVQVFDEVGQLFLHTAGIENIPHLPRNTAQGSVGHFEPVRVVVRHGVFGGWLRAGGRGLGGPARGQQQPQQQGQPGPYAVRPATQQKTKKTHWVSLETI